MTADLNPDAEPLAHVCPVGDCGTLLARHLLMCHKHWPRVPPDLRRSIYRAWRIFEGTPLSHPLRAERRRAHRELADQAVAFANGRRA